ncbi:MAG: hypothetical protein ABI434_22140, partial [Burkholderiaceae bacterium]
GAGLADRGNRKPDVAPRLAGAGAPAQAEPARVASNRSAVPEAALCNSVTAAEPGGVPSDASKRPTAGAAGGSGSLRAAVNTAAMPLRPGMFARVTTVFAINDAAIVVPEEAIVPQGGRQFVIKVVEPSQVPATPDRVLPVDTKWVSLRQEVKLGARQLGKVEVVEGLAEGETVVVAGQQRLQRDGTALRIVELGRPGQRGPAGGAAPAGAASAAPGNGAGPALGASAPGPVATLGN